MHTLVDIYRVDVGGSAEWLDSVESYSVALLKIELIAVEAPGDYAIVNRQSGDRTVLSFGLRSSSSWKKRVRSGDAGPKAADRVLGKSGKQRNCSGA